LLDDNQDLASFFARPIYGVLCTWTPGTSLYGTFNPWNVFFNNKRVANRITNFKLASAKLHIKFMINGSPFHYGRFLVAYIPLHSYDTCTQYPPTIDQQTLWPIVASQRLKVFLDPSEGQGGELVLPFVWPYDNLDLANGDFNNVGQLFYSDLNTLKHANAATTGIQITYAIWAEDVNMGIPTTVGISGLVSQSNEVFPASPARPTIDIPSIASPKAGRDVSITCTCCSLHRKKKPEPLPFSNQAKEEYADQPVSKLASSVARAAGSLSNVPTIGAFARATEIGATIVGAVAKSFGFSKPADLSRPIARMTPRYIGELALTDGTDPVAKLSVDSKQEVTVDPRICGIDLGDELNLAYIAARESFITQFSWATTKVSGDLLFNCRVNPFLGTTSTLRYSPACEFASIPFNHWRGHMAFRIQVVASRQHRGRLAIVWDPNYVKTFETNMAHTMFVDLDETRDVVIKIPWGQRMSYLGIPSNVTLANNFGTTAITSSDLSGSNGVLAVYCLNELAVPNSVANNDVQVNVYACLCDADFAAPNTKPSNITYMLQSNEEFTQETKEETCSEDAVLVAPTVEDSKMSLVYFGEQIKSFRQLFKRYALCYTDMFLNTNYTTTKSKCVANAIRPKFPPYRGAYVGGNNNALHSDGTIVENRVHQHWINYVAGAFACSRGGMRAKIVARIGVPSNFRSLRVARTAAYWNALTGISALDETGVAASIAPQVTYLKTSHFSEMNYDFTGSAVTVVQPVVEVEFPYYMARRFDTPRDTNATTAFGPTNLNNGSYENGYRYYVDYISTSAVEPNFVDYYAAAGEDFTCVWFQGMPPWKIYS